MADTTAYLWGRAPLLRLLPLLITGIVLQWYMPLSLTMLLVALMVSVVGIVIYFFLSTNAKYRFRVLNGILFQLLLIITGALLIWVNDIRNNRNWFGNNGIQGNNYSVVATIQEPLTEKTNSYKAIATVNALYNQKGTIPAEGKIIIYFSKEAETRKLGYGSRITFNKTLQDIVNEGNPGSFDYKRYCFFQGITHQVFLKAEDFVQLPHRKTGWLQQYMYTCRSNINNCFRTYIRGKKEQSFAEALLTGYKDDLDKELVQSYTNTGVVHIIAISGGHLAVIYGLLAFITFPLKRFRRLNSLRILFILTGLWLFSLFVGAQPSVVRAALLFSALSFSQLMERRNAPYNTLALSAFLLLCYNPFWLWDIGFQLSYAAVLSIMLFYKPVYVAFAFSNKLVDGVWKLAAVSLAAQIITTPLSLFYFHQFPVLFLLTNIAAVPLSSLILCCSIILCAVQPIPVLASAIGKCTTFLILFMNNYIERLDQISFATWKDISISLPQTILMLGLIMAFCCWLKTKKSRVFILSLCCLSVFLLMRSLSFIEAARHRMLIVYHLPRHSAIDLIIGRTCSFISDRELPDTEKETHLKPARIMNRIQSVHLIPMRSTCFWFCKKRIMILNGPVQLIQDSADTIQDSIDFLILCGKPPSDVSQLSKKYCVKQVIADGSVPTWKIGGWKRQCDSLHIPFYDVTQSGAFVMNVE